jgi:transmembrane sensor
MNTAHASFVNSIRTTANAYVRPFSYAWEIVAASVRRLWPGVDTMSVTFVFGIIFAGLALAVGLFTELRTPPEVYRARIGEIRTVELSDGSTVQLAPMTEIRVQYVGDFRSVDVRGGEAYFKVAHDARRPFQVNVNGAVVRAVGTAFAVRDRAGAAPELVVAEGNVTVFGWFRAAARETPSGSIRVSEHQMLPLEGRDTAVVRTLESEEFDRRLAWREGRIVFDEMPLARMVEEVNLFSSTRLVIDDPAIAGFRVSGAFRATELGGILAALKEFGVQYRTVVRAGVTEIHLSAEGKSMG